MLTEQQIEDQQEFERKQISGGLHKLRSNTQKLEEKTYASATVYGSAFVSSILPDLIAYIDKKKDKTTHIYIHDKFLHRESSLMVLSQKVKRTWLWKIHNIHKIHKKHLEVCRK